MRMGRAVPDGALAARVLELRDEALKIVRPSQTWRRFPIVEGNLVSGSVHLVIAGTLARHLADCRSAYLACGTLGAGFDTFQRRVSAISGADALIVQAIGAALIEKLMDDIEDKIRASLEPSETLVSRYSPGYGDFPLAAQRELLSLLDAPRMVGVSLTDTLLMVPSKSVSAIIGIKEEIPTE